MKNWTPIPFREIATFPPKVSLVKEESYSFIPMDVVNEGYKFVSPQESKKWVGSGGAKFENGDTLFARITPCLQNGKIAQAKNLPNGKGFGSTEFFVFRGKENVSDSNFIYYLAKTEDFRSYAIGSMVGASGRQRADATYVGNYEVNLPPLPIQKRIAEILSSYDDLIENNGKRIKLLEELAQRTYEEWFVRFRVNGEQLPMDDSTGLPVGWERRRLGELSSFKYGKMPDTKKIRKSGYPIYSGYRITGYYESYLLEEPTIIVIARGVGGTGDVKLSPAYCWLTNLSIYFNIKNGYKLYLLHLLQKENLRSLDSGAAQSQITIGALENYWVNIADADLQLKFHRFCEPIYDKLDMLRACNQLLKESRDILLPRLMNGTIDVAAAAKEYLTQ